MPDVGLSGNSNEKYLLIAAFVQGNNFPKRTRTKFVIEAKFDGEMLSTDPVEHNETIEINQELAWEIDKKKLQLRKLQRSCIKANCFALNEVSGAKENIGYIVLDVRSAPDGIQITKEMPLLQSKYQKQKSTLQCMIYTEGDQKTSISSSSGSLIRLNSAMQNQALSNPLIEEEIKENELYSSSDLKPQIKVFFDENLGYFFIGKANNSQKNYVLTITLVFARNLIKLIPQELPLNTIDSEFFFAFKFLNNQFTSKPFGDIVSGEMNVEKCSIRFLTSLQDFITFLNQNGPLEILFCSGNKIIAKTSLNWDSLSSIVKNKNSLSADSPIIVDHILNLESSEIHTLENRTSPSSETSPVLGVQCILESERSINNTKKLNYHQNPEQKLIDENFSDGSNDFKQGEVIYQNDSTTIKVENNSRQTANENIIMSVKTRQPQIFNIENNLVNHQNEELQLKAAYEFQIWKEHREKEFETHLKKLEAKRFQALADAFKQHDVERELMIQKKIKEYNDLEILLKNSLNEVEKREKQLAFNETQVARLKADLHHEYETKLIELREASKRVQEKADHQLNLQKSKADSLEEEISKYRRQVHDLEKRLVDKEVEFTRFKELDQNRPEVKFQSEINMLKLEKIELERKLDAQTKAKIHYKEQFMKTLQELSLLKKREEANARSLLKQQQIELDQLKKRYIIGDEAELMSSSIRKNDEYQIFESNIKPEKKTNELNLETIDPKLRQRIYRLKEERECLMRTGAYSNTDTIIIELDRRIYDCIKEAKVNF